MSDPKPFPGLPTWLLRIVLTILLCGILILGVALVTLLIFSDTDWIKQSFMDILETSAGGSIDIDHLEVYFLPSPRITLTGLTFTSDVPGPLFSLHAKQVEGVLGWESLWQHKLVVTRGVIQEPEVTLQVPRAREPKKTGEWTFPVIQKLSINDGRLHLLKDSTTETPARLTWERIQITIVEMEPEGPTTFHLAAQSPDQNIPSTLILEGTLNLIDQTQAASSETTNEGIPPFNVRGRVEVSNGRPGRLMSFLSEDRKDPPHVRMNLQSEYAFTMEHDTGTLAFSNLMISLGEWSMTGKFRITGLQTDSPLLKASGSTSPIAIGRLTNLLPAAWLPAAVRTFLAERKVDGTLELLTGTIEGPLNRRDLLMAEGVVRLEEGRFLTAPGYPPMTQVSGTVAFDSRLIRIRDAHGTLSPFTLAAQEATLHVRDAGLDVSIPTFHVSEHDWRLTGKANFTHFQQASPILILSGSAPPISIQLLARLLPESLIPASIRTVIKDRQVEGTMELVTGSVRWPLNGEEPVAADGVIRLEQGHILVDPNHSPLSHIAGAVVFDSNLIRILDFQGRMNSSDLLIKEATLELRDSDILMDLQGGGDLLAYDVIQALIRDPRSRSVARSLAGYQDIQGHIQVATHIEGSLLHPKQLRVLQGNLAMEQINLYPKTEGLAVTTVTGRMTFDHRRLAIQALKGKLGNSPLEVAGQWNFRNGTNSSNLTVRSSLDSSDLLTLFPALSDHFSTFAGSLETTFTISGTTSSPSYRLHVDLTDWSLAKSGVFTKPGHIPGTFDATGHIGEHHTLIITDGELSLPPFKLDVRGSLAMQEPLRFRIGLRTESGTGALLPEGMSLGDERLGLSTLALTLGLQGQDRDWTSWNIQGTVEATDRIRLSDTGGSEPGNKVFRLTWIQKDQKANADLSVSNLVIQSLLPSDLTPHFTGAVTLKTSMDMDLTRSEWSQRFLNGKGDMRLENGHILTSPVLSKILSLLNVQNILMGKINILESGFPVDHLTGTFIVKNGLLSTKNLALKSPVLTMAAAGTYDIPADQIDAIFTVSPFGAYSSLLKRIPLFGTLMKGERKGLTTALFEVKGPRMDPFVTYLPLQSLTGGILGLAEFPLDVLKNLLTLPLPEKKSNLHEDPAKRSLVQ